MMGELAPAWYAQGKVKPVIDRTMPMADAQGRNPYAHMGFAGVKGKLVMVNDSRN
jgi:NADPH2:quinone reductase